MIRKFESFNNNEYYSEISESEFEGDSYKPIDFKHTNELNRWIESHHGFISDEETPLRNMTGFQHGHNYKPFFIGEVYFNKRGLHRRNGVLSYKIESDKWFCIIFESNDEWFWVNLEDQNSPFINYYYKCDQFDGLTKLLKDKKVI